MRSRMTILLSVAGLALAAVTPLLLWAFLGRPGKIGHIEICLGPYEIPSDPPKSVEPDEFRRRYGRYFEPDFQQDHREFSEHVDVDTLHRIAINFHNGPQGTLFIDNAGEVVYAAKFPWAS